MPGTVFVVLGYPEINSLADVLSAKTSVYSVYADEGDAAKAAGQTDRRWYVPATYTPGTTGLPLSANDEGEDEFTIKVLSPVGGSVDRALLDDCLSLVGAIVRPGTAPLAPAELRLAYDWAMREYLHASDNDIERRPRPSFLDQPE